MLGHCANWLRVAQRSFLAGLLGGFYLYDRNLILTTQYAI